MEWGLELGLANSLGTAETIRARVSTTKQDFSLTEVCRSALLVRLHWNSTVELHFWPGRRRISLLQR